MSAFAQSLQGKSSPKPSDRQFIIRTGVASRGRHYGRCRVAGTQVYAVAVGGIFYRVLAHGHGQIDAVERYFLDNREVTIDGSGYVTEDRYKYSGRSRVRIETRDGTANPVHYASLFEASASWTPEHIGKGVFHSLTAFEQVPQDIFLDMFPSAENTVLKIEFRGARVVDVRSGAVQWSDNAALCIRDFLTHEDGFGMPAEWLDVDAFKVAADICDEGVPMSIGGTEPRYRVSLSYTYDERPVDVLSRMLAACNGKFLLGDDGRLALSVGVWRAPEFTIDGSMIEGYAIDGGSDGPETANIIRAAYTSPDHGYTEQDADPWENAADVTLRGAKVADIPLIAVPSHTQARRLMKQAAAIASPEWRGTISCNLAALPVLSHRFVNISLPDLGLSFTAEISGTEMRIADGNVVTGVTVSFISTDAQSFAWSTSEEGRAPEVPPDEDDEDATIQPPAGVTVVIEARTSGALEYPVAVVSWDTVPDWSSVEIQAQIDGSSSWTEIAQSELGAGSVETPPLVDGASYSFRARVMSLFRSSAWVGVGTYTAAVDPVAPGVPTSLSATATGSDVDIDWTQPSSANTAAARVYRNTADSAGVATLIATVTGGASASLTYTDAGVAAGTHWYWVAAVNGSGVESARTPAGSVTIT